jgi:hypothetical protein
MVETLFRGNRILCVSISQCSSLLRAARATGAAVDVQLVSTTPRTLAAQGWLKASLAALSRRSDTAAATHYALSLWDALVRYLDDGRIEIDNSAAERALRAAAVGRRDYSSPVPIAEENAPPSSQSSSGRSSLTASIPKPICRMCWRTWRTWPILRSAGSRSSCLGTSAEACTPQTNSRIDKEASGERVAFDPSSLPHIADLIADGEIAFGVVEPMGCVATVTDESSCLAMLVRRDGETLGELLIRLDLAIARAFVDDICTDEVNARPSDDGEGDAGGGSRRGKALQECRRTV